MNLAILKTVNLCKQKTKINVDKYLFRILSLNKKE